MIDRELAGTCAFLATYLAGIQTHCLWEDGRDRGFIMVGLREESPRVWDALRHSFVHLHPEDDGWRFYDFASAHHLRADRTDDGFTFAIADVLKTAPTLHVRVTDGEVRASGPDGERHFTLTREGHDPGVAAGPSNGASDG